MDDALFGKDRIEEAHGLWELQVARLAAMIEGGVRGVLVKQASVDEREAFRNWQRVSRECGA